MNGAALVGIDGEEAIMSTWSAAAPRLAQLHVLRVLYMQVRGRCCTTALQHLSLSLRTAPFARATDAANSPLLLLLLLLLLL